MAADLIDVDSLLAPLGDDAPCGPDLEYDADMQSLERAAAGTPERQYGDKIFPAEPPDWPQVHELALALARRTRDLRVAVWLTRSSARLLGLGGAARGLALVRGLLEQHWAHVHPQLDASDNNDPTMRLNALVPLAAADAVLADLRAAGLANRRGALTLRELELGLSRDEPHGDEPQPSETGVVQGVGALLAEDASVADTLRALDDASGGIVAAVESQVGSAAPDLSAFTRLVQAGPLALAKLQPDEGQAGAEGEAGGGVGPALGGGGAIRSRGDAIRELERVCEWIERNEPSHPAPLLIRRAQRLMNMRFMEIIQDMAPGGIDQVQTIAGAQPEQA